jgi:hypothetical protein
MELTEDAGQLRKRAGVFRFLSVAQRRNVVPLGETTDARGCAADTFQTTQIGRISQMVLVQRNDGKLVAGGSRMRSPSP